MDNYYQFNLSIAKALTGSEAPLKMKHARYLAKQLFYIKCVLIKFVAWLQINYFAYTSKQRNQIILEHYFTTAANGKSLYCMEVLSSFSQNFT